jgi:DNA-binding transcriptional LysR family regulator
MQLSLDHSPTFAYVIDPGSVSAAAGRLGLSQPAVSLQLKGLEWRLAVRLVERVGWRATPAAAGEELVSPCKRNRSDGREWPWRAMPKHSWACSDRDRCPACIDFLPPVLRQLRARFPSLDIVVSTGNTPDILERPKGERE